MGSVVRKPVVISAVNLRKGGTLTVLRNCLSFLSSRKNLEVTAIVHSEALCHFEGINYIEIPWSARNWFARLWCEYVTLHRLSMNMPEPDLWFSLHDTTPNVRAKRRAVYCHTSFPFLKWTMRDCRMDIKIPLFAMLTRFAYRIGVKKNNYLVVQQNWFREGLSKMTGFPANRIIVAPPRFAITDVYDKMETTVPTFFYPSTPDCHKNFETLCEAAERLENQIGKGRFKVVVTISGKENRYAKWIYSKWGRVASIDYVGFLSKSALFGWYKACDCLVFPSRVETWGLPVSEFKNEDKPMILADLPYARETASGALKAAFFDALDSCSLASLMSDVISGQSHSFASVPEVEASDPKAYSWNELFEILLSDESPSVR